jgi:rSAM/selenodomain-associated transferase 1
MSQGAAVAIVCKTPGVGGGKSRLRPVLGADRVAQLSACFIRDIAATLDALAPAVGGSRIAIYSPAGSEDALRPLLPPHWRFFFQQAATIGEVLHASTSAFLAEGHDCALVVNADSPTLPGRVVEQAVAALREPGDRVVFGPASDGGYYLIGLKRPHARLFEDIVWSTPSVLAHSRDRAREIGLPVLLLPMWYDVDDAETLGVLQAELAGAPPSFAPPGLLGAEPRHTRALLAAGSGGRAA